MQEHSPNLTKPILNDKERKEKENKVTEVCQGTEKEIKL